MKLNKHINSYPLLLLALSATLVTFLPRASAQTEQDLPEVARSVVTADRQAVVVATMQFTDTEAKDFWPLCRQHRSDRAKISDELINLVLEYLEISERSEHFCKSIKLA